MPAAGGGGVGGGGGVDRSVKGKKTVVGVAGVQEVA